MSKPELISSFEATLRKKSERFINLLHSRIEGTDMVCFVFETNLDVFKTRGFSVRYEGLNLANVPDQILNIAFASIMAPIAMACGAELWIEKLDRHFFESLKACRKELEKIHPNWGFDRGYGLVVDILVNGKSVPWEGSALFFSGGLDSMASLAVLKEENPELLMVIGADIPIKESGMIQRVKAMYYRFALLEKFNLRFIYTDVRGCLDTDKLHKYSPNWYASVQFGLMFAGLSAPASYGRFGRVYFSSCSHPLETKKLNCGGDPKIVNNLYWAGAQVEIALPKESRTDKAKILAESAPKHWLGFLRVCWEQFQEVNCGKCEKCRRTICELILAGSNPSLAFPVQSSMPGEMRHWLERNFYRQIAGDTSRLGFWRDIEDRGSMTPLSKTAYWGGFFRWLSLCKFLQKNISPWKLKVMKKVERLRGILK